MADYATSIDIQATPEIVFAHLVTIGDGTLHALAWAARLSRGRDSTDGLIDIKGDRIDALSKKYGAAVSGLLTKWPGIAGLSSSGWTRRRRTPQDDRPVRSRARWAVGTATLTFPA